MGILSKVKDAVIALLVALTGILAVKVGLDEAGKRKRKAKKLRREYERVMAERNNEVYVKKIRTRKLVDDINRMFNGQSGDNGSGENTEH